MKPQSTSDISVIHKDVIIIGNGPSGISLSMMLSGYLPYLISKQHPDEMLSARLQQLVTDEGKSLVEQPLEQLAQGLEGRSVNPISLLLDALEHPCADFGIEMESLLQWKYHSNRQIDHVVFGKGPPGGSWHAMDPNILTLSLGSWMALPACPYTTNTSTDSQRRASAGNIAKYYQHYVRQFNLNKYFQNGVCVLSVESIAKSETPQPSKKCSFVNALNYLRLLRVNKQRRCKRARDDLNHSEQCRRKEEDDNDDDDGDDKVLTTVANGAKWLVTTYDHLTGKRSTYSCCNLVLANGVSDSPNRLSIETGNSNNQLPWVLHSLRSLEDQLDQYDSASATSDPVLIVGAGLSAADAIIATRFRSIPVLHVFRNRSVSFDKHLPENMYPEYHKVHQMMLDGGSTYPLYTALPEYSVLDISATDHTVTLRHADDDNARVAVYKVSFVVILIGSRPNFKFLPTNCSIGVDKAMAIDSKTNPIDIDRLTHAVSGLDGLYAIGPLAGDNFVRFIPGGALAVITDLYKKKQMC